MDDLMMAAVGPDDDFGSNVLPFDNSGKGKEQSLIPVKDDEIQKKVAASTSAGLRNVSNVIDVLEDEEELSFILEPYLPDTGMMYLGGLSGTGKTILAIQLVQNIVLGRPTMTWPIGDAAKGVRALMLSLEMGKKELQLRLKHMMPDLTEEESEILRENFLVYTDYEPFELWNPVHIVDLLRIIKENNVNLLLIDSASVSFASSLKDDTQVNESIKYLYMIRLRLNVAMVVVSHTRKPLSGIVTNPEDVTLNELFGHSGVAQSASSIMLLVEDEKRRKEILKSNRQLEEEKKVHIVNAKTRFGVNGGAFPALLSSKKDVENGSPLQFRRNVIPIEMTDEQRKALRSKKGPPLTDVFKEIAGDLDFGGIEE